MTIGLVTIDEVLRHPLFLVLATGLVSSYLIPRLTKRWQDHEQAIETRTRFASEITETVVRFLLEVQLSERRSTNQERYDRAYMEWEVRRATLESELRGRFVDSRIAADWVSLAEAVTGLYRLSGTRSEPYRSNVIEELRRLFGRETTEWEHLRDFQQAWVSNDAFQTYFAAWWKLREAALQKSGELARRILEAKTTSFD